MVRRRTRERRLGAKTCFADPVVGGIMIAVFCSRLDLASVCLAIECRDSRDMGILAKEDPKTKLAFGCCGQHFVQVERVE